MQFKDSNLSSQGENSGQCGVVRNTWCTVHTVLVLLFKPYLSVLL